MRLSSLAATASAAALLTAAGAARSQSVGGFALDQFEPTPAGDPFFGVPSPAAPGHLAPRSLLIFDYAARPIHLRTEDVDIVSAQGVLHFNASLALWDRVLVSADMPLAIVQSDGEPGLPGITFNALSSPEAGDLRLGVRVRVAGDDGGPFQVGVGGYFFAPTGKAEQYTGEGAARGAGHVAVGGRVGSDVGFLWNAAGGVELTGSEGPQQITYGAGVGLLLAEDLVQVGPEIYGSTPLGGDLILSAMPETRTEARTNLEVLGGVKLRILKGFTFGAAAGPGIVKAVGTPAFRAIGTIGWAPLPPAAQGKAAAQVVQVRDKDDDGIDDNLDACPEVKGDPSPDPAKDGCPPSDRDGDSVLDVDDACPTMGGVRSGDVTKNGCPVDSDEDGVHDGIDACVDRVGEASSDPKRNGCPADRDEDGIFDASDACPTARGAKSPDPKYNGCPEDPDGDGIKFGDDACPGDKGAPDPDPKQNGCPRFVRVTTDEIVTSKPVEFLPYGKDRTQTIDPISDDLLHEVRDVINQNRDIQLVEVQGHTDDMGTEDFNLPLSQERADAVRNWLIQAGVPKEKLVAKGYGFTKPVGDNRVRTGRRQNRRVQFMIVKRQPR